MDCKFDFSAYYSDIAEIDFGAEVSLQSYEDFGVAQTIFIKVPENEIFTDLFLVATLENK